MHGRNEVGQEDWLPGLGKGSNFVQGYERYDYRGRRKSPPSFYLRFTTPLLASAQCLLARTFPTCSLRKYI